MVIDSRLSGAAMRAPWLALLLLAGHAAANPTGPTVAGGQATFSSQGNVLVVTNAPGTIINWQGFSIGPQDLTRFVQQSSGSAVLNRIIGGSSSFISGTLSSNGRVYILSPNGFFFGPNAQVNTAALTVSTGQISNSAFLAGATSPVGGFSVFINAPGGSVNPYRDQLASVARNPLAPPPSPGSIFPGGGNSGVGTVISPPPSPGSSLPPATSPGGMVISMPPSPGVGFPIAGNSANIVISMTPATGFAVPIAGVAPPFAPVPAGTTGIPALASLATTGAVTISGGTGAGIFLGPPPVTGTTAPLNPGAANSRPAIPVFGVPPAMGSTVSSVTVASSAGNSTTTATAAVAPARESPVASAPSSAALVILQKREPVM